MNILSFIVTLVGTWVSIISLIYAFRINRKATKILKNTTNIFIDAKTKNNKINQKNKSGDNVSGNKNIINE